MTDTLAQELQTIKNLGLPVQAIIGDDASFFAHVRRRVETWAPGLFWAYEILDILGRVRRTDPKQAGLPNPTHHPSHYTLPGYCPKHPAIRARVRVVTDQKDPPVIGDAPDALDEPQIPLVWMEGDNHVTRLRQPGLIRAHVDKNDIIIIERGRH